MYLGVFAWFLFILISRWDGVPPLAHMMTSGLGSPPPHIDPALDRTEELFAALAKIPPFPTYTMPPPPVGMEWNRSGGTVDPTAALAGEWTPQTRPHLEALIRYLEDPALEAALADLAGIEPGSCSAGAYLNRGMPHTAARILTARARYRHAELRDFDGAMEDLELVYRLPLVFAVSAETGGWFIASDYVRMALGEAERMAVECAMSADEASRLIDLLQGLTTTPHEEWQRAVATRAKELRLTVDIFYADDGNGNGWLVMSRLDDALRGTPASESRSGAWNVLSILFNDRKAIEARVRREAEQFDQLGALAFAEAKQASAMLEGRSTFTLADGPLCQPSGRFSHGLLLSFVVRRVTHQQGALAAAALAAYRREHGAYPAWLGDLVGVYLDEEPIDWYVRRPLRYERLSANEYRLYSVGENQRDDGGEWRLYSGDARRSADDSAYPRRRPNTSSEPTLKKAGT